MSESNSSRMNDFLTGSYRRLVRFVRQKLDDSADRSGEDIVQDVVLNILDKADVLAPIENLSAYIFRALRNRIVDELRKPKRKIASLDQTLTSETEVKLADLIQDIKEDPSDTLEKEEKLKRIFQALKTLPSRQQMVIIETEFNGRSFKDISRELSIPVGTLLASKSRGLQTIRKKLVSLNNKDKNHALSLV